jgi:hypothetical protein
MTSFIARACALRLTEALAVSVLLCAACATPASARLTAHGQLLKLARPTRFGQTTSDNWFGYNLGALQGSTQLYHAISGTWTVPTATQHAAGQAEDSADWIGIGGGCVNTGCSAGDETLIQTGTEQDVSSTGAASYDAWYELIPAPEEEITSMTVHPGDEMHALITQAVSGSDVWTITLQDLTTGQSYSTTAPYSSTMDTAEWIEETPLEIGTSPGLAALPNLTEAPFTNATVNGANPDLQPSDAIYLTDSSGNVIGAPSAPNSTGNGFTECAWASSCS